MTKKTQNTITKAIFSTVTNTCDVHRRSSSVNALGSESMWVQQDTIAFHRNKLLEKMLDQLSWSTNAADEYRARHSTPRYCKNYTTACKPLTPKTTAKNTPHTIAHEIAT